ncbi:MAG: hypothetical protein ABI597_00825 [Gammaproteobacteria bacterium]
MAQRTMFKRKMNSDEEKAPSLDSLTARNEELKKLKTMLKEQEDRRALLDQEINNTQAEIARKQDLLNKDTIFNFNPSTINIPSVLSGDAKTIATALLQVVQLIQTKYAYNEIWGELNLLDSKKPAKLIFPRYTDSADALKYLKSLGYTVTETPPEGYMGGSSDIKLSISECTAAITGLKMLTAPTADEVEARPISFRPAC